MKSDYRYSLNWFSQAIGEHLFKMYKTNFVFPFVLEKKNGLDEVISSH